MGMGLSTGEVLYAKGEYSRHNSSRIVKRAVLVLNKNYIPCYVSNLKHAFSLLFRESAYVLDSDFSTYTIHEWLEFEPSDGEEYISTVSRRIRIPRIVITQSSVSMHINKPKVSRLGVFIRDGFRCQYCGARASPKNLTVDHVVPKSRGGKTDWMNVVTSCMDCNIKKGDRTPEEANMFPIKEPHVPFISILNARDIDLKFHPEWEQFLLR